jgi:hypothetical protein
MISILLSTAIVASYPGADLPDGSILYLTNSNKAVHLVTDSKITHVALLLSDSKKRRWVYEATPAQVRRVPLAAYHHELGELNAERSISMRLYAMKPSKAYQSTQLERMKSYLDKQLGRRYSVKGYVRKTQGDGIHCAELVSRAVGRTGRAQFQRNYALTPSDVVKRTSKIYDTPKRLKIYSRPAAKQQTWCQQSWDSWDGWSSWCGWSLRESWSWCW